MSYDIISLAPGADVATNGTITFPYPDGRNASSYYPVSTGAKLWVEAHDTLYSQGNSGFTLSYEGGGIVATYKGSTTIPAGSTVKLQATVKNFSVVADPDQAQANIPVLTEDGGAIGGTNDGDLPDLEPSYVALDNVISASADAQQDVESITLSGSLTGSTDGALADVVATAAATEGDASPSAAQVDAGIATAVSSVVAGVNTNLKEIQAKLVVANANDATIAAAVVQLAADVAALRAAVRELAVRSNDHTDTFVASGLVDAP